MSFDRSGIVTFDKFEGTFRYRVRAEVESLAIWLEDRKSKAQWQTLELKAKDFVTADNVIARTDVAGYAKRFANCLGAKELDDKSEYYRELFEAAKDGSRQLCLSFRVCVGGFETLLEYTFQLMPIALERVDVLAAQVRDLGDDLCRHQASIESQLDNVKKALGIVEASVNKLVEEKRDLTFARFVATGYVSSGSALLWQAPSESSPGFTLSSDATTITFGNSGLFSVTTHLHHCCTNYAFECQVNGQAFDTLAGQGRSGFILQTTATLVRVFKAGDKLAITHRGDNYAGHQGSSLTIVELRRE
ncbi:hypothetical protein Poli38472_013654 [Pythium oligandrum]|uniref:Uncharacterized protein n=1 Tax=Pythium oligandrum TaxID=41045 RepID=A0A8K1CD46_PYTOL|nr:hypothetical protein Poli38472_013654 [Pythium oligandrum]|eukprot:TMW61191.1 hypothetical protein Poli38472_013654 [Pythium oligandrum]